MDASPPDFDALLRRWETAGTAGEQVQVLRAVCVARGHGREARVVHLVLEAFDHEAPEVRREAVRVVARCPWSALLEVVDEVAAADPDPEVRALAQQLLDELAEGGRPG